MRIWRSPNPQIAPPLYSAWLLNPGNNTFKPIVPPTEGVMVTDIVSLQARPPPAYIPPLNASPLTGDNAGIIDIRSVYDWADATNPEAIGAETNAQTIARMSLTPADSRRARFMRIEKIVSLGDIRLNDGFPDFNRNIALDNSPGYMREILGYVPIEADGSVRVKVPSEVAFKISILDARAHRLAGFPLHRTWLQLRAGEVLQCNGCHNASTPTSTTSHGRSGLFIAENAGDATGQTMAQVLYGNSTDCSVTACNAASPSVDVIYKGSGAPGDTSVNLLYSKLTTPAPITIRDLRERLERGLPHHDKLPGQRPQGGQQLARLHRSALDGRSRHPYLHHLSHGHAHSNGELHAGRHNHTRQCHVGRAGRRRPGAGRRPGTVADRAAARLRTAGRDAHHVKLQSRCRVRPGAHRQPGARFHSERQRGGVGFL